MKELDVLLSDWLQHQYPQATSRQRLLFEQLLELQDPVLADYLLGHAAPVEPDLAALVAGIRQPTR